MGRVVRLRTRLSERLDSLSGLGANGLILNKARCLGSCVLPPILAAFRGRCPNIRLRLMRTDSGRLVRVLHRGGVSLAFGYVPGPGSGFQQAPVFGSGILITIPASCPVGGALGSCTLATESVVFHHGLVPSYPTVASLTPFTSIPFVLLAGNGGLCDHSITLFRSTGVSPVIQLRISRLIATCRLIYSNLNTTFVDS